MAGTLAISTGKPLSFSSENRLLSSSFNTNNRSSNQHMSFSTYPNPTTSKSTTVRAYAGTAGGVMERRKSSSATTSLYEVLRVKQNASPTEIKTAYRTLAKVYHPDAASESDGRDFIEIHNAYATLSDPSARALYDLSLGFGNVRSFSCSSRSSVYSTGTRRWETDQCW